MYKLTVIDFGHAGTAYALLARVVDIDSVFQARLQQRFSSFDGETLACGLDDHLVNTRGDGWLAAVGCKAKVLKVDLLDREVDMLKQFIRYESASGYKEEEVWHTVNTRNNHKDRETGRYGQADRRT